MFQTFTGSSRRPRQVDLSGRKANPWAAGAQSGPQQALQSAQNDRRLRQKQREELAAAKVLQRIWRGHTARLNCKSSWREQWDHLYQGGQWTENDALACHRLLVAFAQPTDNSDVRRVLWAYTHLPATDTSHLDMPWPVIHQKAVLFCLMALHRLALHQEPHPQTLMDLLGCVTLIISTDKRALAAVAPSLLEALGGPLQHLAYLEEGLFKLLKTTLDCADHVIYGALAQNLLTRPLGTQLTSFLVETVDRQKLWQAAISKVAQISYDFRPALWLLGNLAHLMSSWPQEVNGRNQRSALFDHGGSIASISKLLGIVAENIDAEAPPTDISNAQFDAEVLASRPRKTPLNVFLRTAIHRLVDEGTIRSVFGEFRGTSQGDSTNLATYVLTLLRVFYTHSDDIRMWLYLGPQSQQDGRPSSSAIAFFWNTARQSQVVRAVMQDYRAAIQLITYQPGNGNFDPVVIDDWKSVLIFLELYTFILKLMDDEEFLGNARPNSNSRLNPLTISDNVDLVTFLKHLGFAMYYHANQITAAFDPPSQPLTKRGLGRMFGVVPDMEDDHQDEQSPNVTLAGLPGVSLDYVKGIVTGLVRAIYERDSRRPFLPKNHWLMTSEFDMSNFITDVVAEEQNRHQVEDADDEEEEAAMDAAVHVGHRRLQEVDNLARRNEALRRASRRRYLQNVAPRLEILQHMPFIIPFDIRVEIFRQFVFLDQSKRRRGLQDPDIWRHLMLGRHGGEQELLKHHATVRRKQEFRDSMDQFFQMGASIKEPIQITFVDDFGMQEAGIDGGGVTKEFLTSAVANGFSQTLGLFRSNDQHLLYPNPTAVEELRKEFRNVDVEISGETFEDRFRWLLNEYEYAGRLIGKCLYEGILVDISFTGFFLRQWALAGNLDTTETAHRANINDLRDLDESLYQGLLSLKNYQGNVEDLALTFVVTDEVPNEDGSLERVERELIPNGRHQAVTNQNRLIYISRVARYRLQEQSHGPTKAFLKGLSLVIKPSWLAMFNQSELQNLVGGAATSINVEDLRRNTIYGGVYAIGDDGLEHPCVQDFWTVMHELSDEDKGKVLKFVTSTPRAPLLGFSSLRPKFSIRDSGTDVDRFPTTSTCVNLLKLPRYKSKDIMKEKLLYAVNSGAGFDLS